MRRIACHEDANANNFARLASTCLALVPTSATLIGNRGFRAAIATVSAVDVFPTPGGPKLYVSQGCQVANAKGIYTVKQKHQTLPFIDYNVVHIQIVVIVL